MGDNPNKKAHHSVLLELNLAARGGWRSDLQEGAKRENASMIDQHMWRAISLLLLVKFRQYINLVTDT